MHGARFCFHPGVSVALVAFLTGCSSAPKPSEYTARELAAAACSKMAPRTVVGSIWTKMKSTEMSGQFPATVRVDYPQRLAVEVTNLIGSPQAWLKMEQGRVELRYSEANAKEYGKPPTLQSTLGGLPLEYAPRLFAGGVPCPPNLSHFQTHARARVDGELELDSLDRRTGVRTVFRYRFDRYQGKPWVKEIEIEAHAKKVTIQRSDPSGEDGAPRRWSASSDRGEIQVRWKDRSIL